jgi:hypothetical protein
MSFGLPHSTRHIAAEMELFPVPFGPVEHKTTCRYKEDGRGSLTDQYIEFRSRENLALVVCEKVHHFDAEKAPFSIALSHKLCHLALHELIRFQTLRSGNSNKFHRKTYKFFDISCY